ncbi:MAG TPA: YceI family protein [Steroidobacteraceae bacterium]|nr:YceI family protein [Steroidobacteraceae bacterium]
MNKFALAVTSSLIVTAATAAAAAANAASFTADTAPSRLEFVGVQAGAEFKGVFHKFTASVEFAPDALAGSRIDVQIDMNSVDSKDKDRDTTMRDKDVFDVSHNPTAHYLTKTITKTATGFAAVGALTLRGVTKDVPIEFQFAPAGGGAKLSGSAKLNRLDFGVGQGEWKSTETIGDAVKINFSLVLKPKS